MAHTARHPVMHVLSQSHHHIARECLGTASMLFVDLCQASATRLNSSARSLRLLKDFSAASFRRPSVISPINTSLFVCVLHVLKDAWVRPECSAPQNLGTAIVP